MSKFLTPPVWYDKNGEEINIFNNTTYHGTVENTAIGTSAIAGGSSSVGGAVAVGSQAQAKEPLSIAIGSYNDDNFQTVQALAYGSIAIGGGAKANADSTDGIAIGSRATSGQGGIAIGAGASATANQIQLGNPSSRYDLKIGDGVSGTVNGVDFSSVFKTVGRIKMASEAFTIYNKTSTDNESNVVNFSGLEPTGKYLIAIRYAFKAGVVHKPEGSAFIIINQNYRTNTVTYGDISAGLTNGQMVLVFPKYTKTNTNTGELQMQTCSFDNGTILDNINIDIIMAYAILIDT